MSKFRDYKAVGRTSVIRPNTRELTDEEVEQATSWMNRVGVGTLVFLEEGGSRIVLEQKASADPAST